VIDESGAPAHSSNQVRPSLLAMVASRARRTSDGALAACAGAGLIALALLVAIHPRWGALLLPFVALGAFGAWGIADRELAPRLTRVPRSRAVAALVAARWISAALGTVAAIAGAMWLMTVLLGPFIS
jgi:hypothetical protein